MNAFLAPLSPIVIAVLCMAPAMAQPASVQGDEEEEKHPPRYEEKVTVTATRLPLRDEDASRVPASVTVIDRAFGGGGGSPSGDGGHAESKALGKSFGGEQIHVSAQARGGSGGNGFSTCGPSDGGGSSGGRTS